MKLENFEKNFFLKNLKFFLAKFEGKVLKKRFVGNSNWRTPKCRFGVKTPDLEMHCEIFCLKVYGTVQLNVCE